MTKKIIVVGFLFFAAGAYADCGGSSRHHAKKTQTNVCKSCSLCEQDKVVETRRSELAKELSSTVRAYMASYNQRAEQASSIWQAHKDTFFAEMKELAVYGQAQQREFLLSYKKLMLACGPFLKALPEINKLTTVKEVFEHPATKLFLQATDDLLLLAERSKDEYFLQHNSPFCKAMYGDLPSLRPLISQIVQLLNNPKNDILLRHNQPNYELSNERREKLIVKQQALINILDELENGGPIFDLQPTLKQLGVLNGISEKAYANPTYTRNIAMLFLIIAQAFIEPTINVMELASKNGLYTAQQVTTEKENVKKFAGQLTAALKKLCDDAWFGQLSKQEQTSLTNLGMKLYAAIQA